MHQEHDSADLSPAALYGVKVFVGLVLRCFAWLFIKKTSLTVDWGSIRRVSHDPVVRDRCTTSRQDLPDQPWKGSWVAPERIGRPMAYRTRKVDCRSPCFDKRSARLRHQLLVEAHCQLMRRFSFYL